MALLLTEDYLFAAKVARAWSLWTVGVKVVFVVFSHYDGSAFVGARDKPTRALLLFMRLLVVVFHE